MRVSWCSRVHSLIINSAGVRDSALTVQGNLQAERLGKYLAERALRFTHVFSSDLQRATRTASAICSAQPRLGAENTKIEPTSLEILREQDFGFYEGKPFYARQQDPKKSGKDQDRSKHQSNPDFVDVETKESMATRMDQFLQDHLVPILSTVGAQDDMAIAIVSHGIILSHLWRCFLQSFAKNSVSISPGLAVGTGGVTPLEYLGGWSNTGYLELHVSKAEVANPEAALETSCPALPMTEVNVSSSTSLHTHKMVIKAVNGKEHLVGLKRTRGVSSAQFDEGQKKIETFFKKRKV